MMMYTKSMFGRELKEQLLQKREAVEIGIWAYSVYLNCCSQVDARLLQLMLGLNTMELGPEFIRSYSVLNKIADDLIAGKDIDLNAEEYRDNNDVLG